ncbi:MAG: hypothetical protein Alpg2KO_21060 [Alphaproteobacteria bacterium]
MSYGLLVGLIAVVVLIAITRVGDSTNSLFENVSDTLVGVANPAGASAEASPEVKLVFITSTTHDGILGGLSGADSICNGDASAAGLSGSYKAWLGQDTGGLQTPNTTFTQNDGPYTLVDGTVIADDWDDLTDGSIDNVINLQADGAGLSGPVPLRRAWTNVTSDGSNVVTSSGDCVAWSSNDGLQNSSIGNAPNATDSTWTELTGAVPCNAPRRLLCFQQ